MVLAEALGVVGQSVEVGTSPEVVPLIEVVGRGHLVTIVLDEGDEGLVVLEAGDIGDVGREGQPL